MLKADFLQPSNLNFLEELKRNNNREWFNNHKDLYQQEFLWVSDFAEALLNQLNRHDLIETPSGKKSLYRIYRDVRFSKDKTPFQTYWGGGFRRATKYRRGGYYYHFEKGNSFIAGGFWGPSASDLKLVRESILFDAEPFRKILADKSFIENFESLKGEKLKTAPKGYDKDHNDIDLLRYKQFLLVKRFTDEEVLSKDFLVNLNNGFTQMRPFFDLMSEILTTDANGLEI
jgi:uncharacterized protein (TIGR02453 family)